VTDAAMSAVHDLLGVWANSVLAALLGMLAFALTAQRLRRRGHGWLATTTTVWLAFFCTVMSIGVRPQVLELVYLAALGLLIDAFLAGTASPRRFVLSVVALSLVWVNTHGSFPLLAALLGISAAGELIERDPRWKWLAGSALVAALVALANPWGWRVYEFATQSVMSAPTLTLIDEWKRPNLASWSLMPFDVAVVLAGIAAVQIIARRGTPPFREKAGPRAGVGDALVFLALLYLGVTSGRHVMLFGIGAAPLIASTLSRLFTLMRAGSDSTAPVLLSGDIDTPAAHRINRAAAVVVAAALGLAGWQSIKPEAQREAYARRYPVGLVPALASLHKPSSRMFNEYAWGGFLIANGITPVFIDGRSEVYGDDQLVRYGRIIRLSDGWRRTLDSLAVSLAVVKRDAPLAAMLPRIGWKVAARDSVGVVLTRP
jgi:hypothetical protein